MLSKILYIEIFHGLYLVGILLLLPILILIAVIYKIVKVLWNSFTNKDIRGQVAVITGSGRGLGRDIANELASRGCHIAVVDIQEKLAIETAKYLVDTYSVKAKAYKIDVRDYDQLLKLRDSVTDDLGQPTILINNAAIIIGSSLDNSPPQEIKQMVDVNFTALCYSHQIFLPKMKELNRGHIVNISSLGALLPIPPLNVYCATKSAIRSLSSCLRMECLLEHKNITVTTVMPSFMQTNKRCENVAKLGGVDHLAPLLEGEMAAKYVVNGMLRDYREITVPTIFSYICCLSEIFPVFIKELFIKGIYYWSYQKMKNCKTIPEILKTSDLNE